LTEQMLDVKGSLRIMRRFWRTVAVVVLVGMAVATGYAVLRPAQYHATSLVLLPTTTPAAGTSGSAATSNDITTDGRIATSAAVLGPAGRQVDPSLSVSALEQRVKTSADATGVLAITATGPTAQQSEALANAVANHLVTFVTTSGSTASADALTGLQAEANQLNTQITDVQKELTAANQRLAAVGPSSSAGQQDSDLVGKLTSEQSSLALQLDTVKSQISETRLGQISANQGTEVIQKATDAKGFSKTSLVLMVGMGALGGLFVGSLVVLALHRRDSRLWTRDELAEALGSPVVLSLDATGRRTSKEWIALLEGYQPSSTEQWSIRRALRELGVGDGGGSNLVVLAFADDMPSVAQAAQVAVSAAGTGLETLFSFAFDGEPVASLQAACARFDAEGQGPRPGLEVGSGVLSQRSTAPDLTVTVLVLDRDHPTIVYARRPGTIMVLSVSAGSASAEQLARVAIAAADNGEPLKGIFVANPGSADQTVGRFPESTARTSLVLHRLALGGAGAGVVSGRAR
jgi:capsular polysaccharide biosynthesis protein